jgi:hypothetical protein
VEPKPPRLTEEEVEMLLVRLVAVLPMALEVARPAALCQEEREEDEEERVERAQISSAFGRLLARACSQAGSVRLRLGMMAAAASAPPPISTSAIVIGLRMGGMIQASAGR